MTLTQLLHTGPGWFNQPHRPNLFLLLFLFSLPLLSRRREADVENITILDDVFFAFEPQLAL